MSQFVYTMIKLGKVVPPNRVILNDITLGFLPGAKIGVIGHNGAGKSSLLKIMAGLDEQFVGEARPGSGVSVGMLAQEPELDETKDVGANVMEGVAPVKALLDEFEELSAKFAEPMDEEEMNALLERQGGLQDRIDAVNGWEIERTLEIAMDALRCPPADAKVATLSGGERRRVALCRLLLQKPDLLLLDEPTNHLDAESVEWLEQYLDSYPGTVVAVTHDRYFLDNAAGWILELDRGRGIPFEGNYSSWLEQKQRMLELEEKQESKRRRTLRRELEWIRMTPKARHQKNKARINQFDELLSQAALERRQKSEITIPTGRRLGKSVIKVEHLRKGYGDRLLIDDLSFAVPPGEIVGVIGPNGVGKTTLCRMLMGQEDPDGGTIHLGETVDLAYVDQSRQELDSEKTVWEEISGEQEVMQVGKYEMNSRAYCASFNFKGADQQKKVGKLSGGERNRLHLAKLLKSGGNVLLLDEPTNDLDVDTLRALEDALLEFAGCALVISHDRWFLDRIATHILAFEGESQVRYFEGNYQDYENDRRSRLQSNEARPRRTKFKKLEA